MRISGFIRLPKHRTFNYVPRYYDPQKEELEKVVKNAELGIPQKLNKQPKKINYYFDQRRASAKQSFIRKLIVFATLILLLVVLYYIFDVVYLIF